MCNPVACLTPLHLLVVTPCSRSAAEWTSLEKRYTFILKDELLAPSDNGREQATVSWEIDFELPPQTKPGDTHDKSVFVPWKSLNPTYRGKLKKDAEPLNLKTIQRMSLMMRR